jgi:hypothetical protein
MCSQHAQLGSDGDRPKQGGPTASPPHPASTPGATTTTMPAIAAVASTPSHGAVGWPLTRLISLKGRALRGCAAGARHTVVYAAAGVYAWGEHGGQLGALPAGSDRLVHIPRCVPLHVCNSVRRDFDASCLDVCVCVCVCLCACVTMRISDALSVASERQATDPARRAR